MFDRQRLRARWMDVLSSNGNLERLWLELIRGVAQTRRDRVSFGSKPLPDLDSIDNSLNEHLFESSQDVRRSTIAVV